MVTVKVKFENMEQAVDFVRLTKTCRNDVDIRYRNSTLDAKSLMGVLSMVNAGVLEAIFYGDEDYDMIRDKLEESAA